MNSGLIGWVTNGTGSQPNNRRGRQTKLTRVASTRRLLHTPTRSGLSLSLLVAGALLSHNSNAFVNVDHTHMYLPTGVEFGEGAFKGGRVTFRPFLLDNSQKSFLASVSNNDLLGVYVKTQSATGFTNYSPFWTTLDGKATSVSEWNSGVGSPYPDDRYPPVVVNQSNNLQAGPMIPKEICMGRYSKTISSFRAMPNTVCFSAPPGQTSCSHHLSSGTLDVGSVGNGAGFTKDFPTFLTSKCEGPGKVTLKYGPVSFGAGGEGLVGKMGAGSCNNLSATLVHDTAGGEITNICLRIDGKFNSTGQKSIPGALTIIYP